MEGYCSTGQSPQWAVVPVEEEEEEEEEDEEEEDEEEDEEEEDEEEEEVALEATSSVFECISFNYSLRFLHVSICSYLCHLLYITVISWVMIV
jgi:hypothetical protein